LYDKTAILYIEQLPKTMSASRRIFQKKIYSRVKRSLHKDSNIYENTRLIGDYSKYEGLSEIQCWNKCLEETQCVAISRSGSACYLFKKGEYTVKRETSWFTMTKGNETLYQIN